MKSLEKLIKRSLIVLGIAGALSAHELPKLDGLTNAANPNNKVAACSLATVWGKQLADKTSYAAVIPLPETLDDKTYVEINGIRANLLFSSEGQINLQVPCELAPGTYNVSVIHNGARSEVKPVQISASGPGIFTLPPLFGNNLAAGVIYPNERYPNGRIVGLGNSIGNVPTSPAELEDLVLFYTTGLSVVGNMKSGIPAAEPYDLSSSASVLLNGQPKLIQPSKGEHLVWHPQFVGAQQGALSVPNSKTGIYALSVRTTDGESANVDFPIVSSPNYATGSISTTDKKSVVFAGSIKNSSGAGNTFSSSKSGNYIVDIPGARGVSELELILTHPSYWTMSAKVRAEQSGKMFNQYAMFPIVLDPEALYIYDPNPTNPNPNPNNPEGSYFKLSTNPSDMLSVLDMLRFKTRNGIFTRINGPLPNKIYINKSKLPKPEALPYLEKAARAWDSILLGPKFQLVDYDPREEGQGGVFVSYDTGNFIRISRNSKGVYIGTVFIAPQMEAKAMGDVLTHELGHWLGLSHSPSPKHIMYFAIYSPYGRVPVRFENELCDIVQNLPDLTNIKQYQEPENFSQYKQNLLKGASAPLLSMQHPLSSGQIYGNCLGVFIN